MYVEVDEIDNPACAASRTHCQLGPLQTTKTSIHGAINMLGLANRLKAKILELSTGEVHGDPEVHSQAGSYCGQVDPIGMRSCYDEGRHCAEPPLFDYHWPLNLRIKVARIFNCYGPRPHPHDGRVASTFVVPALKYLPITILGNGTQRRSFCYVDDLIDGFLQLMDTRSEVTGPIDPGISGDFNNRELAENVIALTGSRSRPGHELLPSDVPRQCQLNINLTSDVLGGKTFVWSDQGQVPTIAAVDEHNHLGQA